MVQQLFNADDISGLTTQKNFVKHTFKKYYNHLNNMVCQFKKQSLSSLSTV